MSVETMIKRRILVTIETEVDVEVPAFMVTPEAIENFCKGLWPIKGVDDIAKHAAVMAAQFGDGEYDGLGKLVTDLGYSKKEGDVFYTILSHDIESEVQS